MKETPIYTPEFERLVKGFAQELDKEKDSESYAGERTSYLKEFFSYCEMRGKRKLKQIDQEFADQYFKYLETQRKNERRGGLLSEDTVNKHKGALRVFLKYCEEEEIEVNNIVIKQKKKRDRAPKAKTVLSHEEIQWLYSVTDNTVFGIRDRCMLALYYGCGIRRSEGLNLELTDIDFNKGRILIRQPKNKRDRYVLMSPRVQHFVEEYVYRARDLYLSEDNSFQHLFISERGVPMHGESMDARIESLWNRVKERYPVEKPKIGLHLLRHSLGTHLYLAGMDIEKIALMLGHRCLEATQIYINLAQLLKP